MAQEKLIAVQRNIAGDILSFKTSTGRIISYRKAILETEAGLIDGVHLYEDDCGAIVISPNDEFSFEQYPNIY